MKIAYLNLMKSFQLYFILLISSLSLYSCQQDTNAHKKIDTAHLENPLINSEPTALKKEEPINASEYFTINTLDILKQDAGLHNIESATTMCQQLEQGWRLPNSEELTLLFEHNSELGEFTTRYYLGSDFDPNEDDQKVAYRLDIMTGDIEILQTNEELNSLYGFRPVRNH